MQQSGISMLEKTVFVSDKKQPMRLIIGLVPQEVYDERIRKKQEKAKKKGEKIQEKTKIRYHFNLFITNVDSDKLPKEKVLILYRFRWQIELMFKCWKSVFSIHKFQKMKLHRYITMIYMRLLLIIINLQIVNRIQSIFSKQGLSEKILSYQKSLQTLKERFVDILNLIRSDVETAVSILRKLQNILSKNHWRANKKIYPAGN